MSNLTDLAFPLFEPGGTDGSVSKGFSKHEYATILIAGHLTTKYQYLPTIQEGREIAATAHFLASQVLATFK